MQKLTYKSITNVFNQYWTTPLQAAIQVRFVHIVLRHISGRVSASERFDHDEDSVEDSDEDSEKDSDESSDDEENKENLADQFRAHPFLMLFFQTIIILLTQKG